MWSFTINKKWKMIGRSQKNGRLRRKVRAKLDEPALLGQMIDLHLLLQLPELKINRMIKKMNKARNPKRIKKVPCMSLI